MPRRDIHPQNGRGRPSIWLPALAVTLSLSSFAGGLHTAFTTGNVILGIFAGAAGFVSSVVLVFAGIVLAVAVRSRGGRHRD